MTVQRVDHVQLATPRGGEDLARSFYGELPGLPEKPKPANLAMRGGCWFESDTVRIHPGRRTGLPAGQEGASGAVGQRLAFPGGGALGGSPGVEVVDDEPLESYQRVYTSDPFGNRLELMEPDDR